MILKKAIAALNEGDAKGFVDGVTQVLERQKDKDYASFCKHLQIKNPLGIKRPILKRMASEIMKKAKCKRECYIEGGRLMWKQGTSEHRALTIMMLSYLIQRDSDFTLVLSSKFIKRAASNCDSWELADDFGMNVLGLILAKDIYQLDEIITWTEDENQWLRRTIAVAAWGLYQHAKSLKQNRVQQSLELLGRLMTSPEQEVRYGVMWPLRMLCKYEANACIPFMRHWLAQKDENARWIIEQASTKLSMEDLMRLDDVL